MGRQESPGSDDGSWARGGGKGTQEAGLMQPRRGGQTLALNPWSLRLSVWPFSDPDKVPGDQSSAWLGNAARMGPRGAATVGGFLKPTCTAVFPQTWEAFLSASEVAAVRAFPLLWGRRGS